MMATGNRSPIYTGTFFVCLALLAYEIFCSRLLVMVIGNQMIFAVLAIAMLGLSVASSCVSVSRGVAADRLDSVLARGCLLLGLTVIGALFALTELNQLWNEWLASGAGGGMSDIAARERGVVGVKLLVTGAVLCVPYLVFGVVIARLFRHCPSDIYHRVYFWDLAGAALGCVVLVLSFEWFGYRGALAVVIATPFLACACFAGAHRKLRIAGSLSALAAVSLAIFPGTASLFEPIPSLRLLSRGHDREYEIEEHWRGWNSYSRVSLLSMSGHETLPDEARYFLGIGDGMAHLAPYAPPSPTRESEFARGYWLAAFATMYDPQDVLVVMAGVGKDMLEIDKACGGQCNITGVELNGQMVAHARGLPEYRLDEFLSRDEISLVVSEGREFLGRDTKRYDSIVLSWSGASFAYYAGTAGNTVQYLYTKESFQTFLEKLRPGGSVLIMNTNKALQLFVLREIFEENDWGDLSRNVVIFKRREIDVDEGDLSWQRVWDYNHLLVTKRPFSSAKLARFREVCDEQGYEIVYAPDVGVVVDEFEIYGRILGATDPTVVRRRILHESGVDFSVPTDDRPFALDLTPRQLVFQPWKWFRSPRDPAEAYRLFLYKFVAFVSALSVVAIMGPVVLTQRGPARNWHTANHLLYFLAIGLGFMFVEVGVAQKLSLPLGHPGLSLAVSLGSLILATGLGSLASDRLTRLGILDVRRAALLLLSVIVVYVLLGEVAIVGILPWPLWLKVFASGLALLPIGLLAGYFFPCGLRQARADGEEIVAWAWAINGAASTVAAALGVALAPAIGFSAVIALGGAAYAILLFLPRYAARESQTALGRATRERSQRS